MTKPKILHAISGLGTGGAERMLVKFVLSTRDIFEHQIVTLNGLDTQGEVLLDHGIMVYTIDINPSDLPFSFWRLVDIRKKLKIWAPDIMQGWMYHGNILAWLLRYNKKPLFFNIRHSLHDIRHEKLHTRLAIHLNARLSHKTRYVIFNSKVSIAQHDQIGFDQHKPKLIPNGFDTALFCRDPKIRDKVRNEFSIPTDSILFGHIGRNHPMKGHLTLLKSVHQIIDKIPNAHFLIVGNNVDDDPHLNSFLNVHQLNEYFTLSDERKDVDRILKSLDYCILPSLWGEAFPNIVGEAMSSQVPCIVTNVGDAGLLVGESGFVVNPGDTNALSDAILKAYLLPDEQKNDLGVAARIRIMNDFGLESICKMYADTYFQVL